MPIKKRSQRNAPATRGDLNDLRDGLLAKIKKLMEDRFERQEQLLEQRLQQQTNHLELRMQQHENELDHRLQQHTDEIKRHFSVVIENAYADLVGANRDRINLLANYHDNHEQRITALEKKVS